MRRLLHVPAAVLAPGAARARRHHRRRRGSARAAVSDQDRHRSAHRHRPARGPRHGWRCSFSRFSSPAFASEYLQTWTMQLTGQRIMFDLRMAIYGHLQRLDLRFYDRNPVGRLMTRVTSDVDVLNDLFTSGVVTDLRRRVHARRHHGRHALDELAAGAGRVLRAAADRRSSRSGSGGTSASRTASCAGCIARINAFLQENITGMSTVQLFRREALNFDRFDEIDRAAPRREHRVDLLLRGVLSGDRGRGRARLGADHLVRRRRRAARHADARRARRVPAVLAAVLPADQRHVGEVQRAAGGDGVVGAHLQAARRARRHRAARRAPVARPAPARRATSSFDHVWFAYNGERLRAARRAASRSARPARRHRRRDRLRQDDAHQPAAAVLRRAARADHRRRRGHPRARSRRTCAACSASCCRTCTCSPARSPTTSGSGNTDIDDDRRDARGRGRARRRVHRAAARRLSDARSPSAARRCRSGRSSCCRSRARWRSTRAC